MGRKRDESSKRGHSGEGSMMRAGSVIAGMLVLVGSVGHAPTSTDAGVDAYLRGDYQRAATISVRYPSSLVRPGMSYAESAAEVR